MAGRAGLRFIGKNCLLRASGAADRPGRSRPFRVFDDGGYPAGAGWEEIPLPHNLAPDHRDPNLYALSISGDSMEPVYRSGDTIIVSPATSVRTGDRVVARTVQGEVMAKVLARRTRSLIELASLNPLYEPRRFAAADIAAMHRIVWASQ